MASHEKFNVLCTDRITQTETNEFHIVLVYFLLELHLASRSSSGKNESHVVNKFFLKEITRKFN